MARAIDSGRIGVPRLDTPTPAASESPITKRRIGEADDASEAGPVVVAVETEAGAAAMVVVVALADVAVEEEEEEEEETGEDTKEAPSLPFGAEDSAFITTIPLDGETGCGAWPWYCRYSWSRTEPCTTAATGVAKARPMAHRGIFGRFRRATARRTIDDIVTAVPLLLLMLLFRCSGPDRLGFGWLVVKKEMCASVEGDEQIRKNAGVVHRFGLFCVMKWMTAPQP